MIKTRRLTKKPSRTALQTKADRLYQEIGRQVHKRCLVCGGDYSCLHHFVKKSQSTALRYDFENGIPLCHKCHSSIHVALNDLVSGRIVAIKGKKWLDEMERKKREGAGLNYGIRWYEEMVETLGEISGK